jgi:capsular polysaccharide biosynthesis protein
MAIEPSLREPLLSDYTAALRRRWPVVVAFVIVGLVLAAAAYVAFPKSYSATAAVEVTPTGVASQSGTNATSRSATGTNVDLDTEAQIVKSTLVATRVRQLLHTSTSVNQLVGDVTATVPPNSSVLDIACTWKSAKGAQACANAFANAYLQQRAALAEAALHSQITNVQNSIASITAQIHTLTTALVAGAKTSKSTAAYDRIRKTALQGELTGLNNQLAPLEATVVTPGSIISTPRLGQATARKSYFAVAGGLLGLILGLIFAGIAESRDRRIHGPRDVERRTGVGVIGDAVLDGPEPSWAQLLRTGTPAGHAVGLARNAVEASGDGRRTALVLPVRGGVSGRALAGALTVSLARSEGSAVLVTPSESFADAAAFVEGEPGVQVVEMTPDVVSSHHKVENLVAQVTASMQPAAVVVEAPPASQGGDSAALAAAVGGVVVVVDANRTRYPDLQSVVMHPAHAETSLAPARAGGRPGGGRARRQRRTERETAPSGGPTAGGEAIGAQPGPAGEAAHVAVVAGTATDTATGGATTTLREGSAKGRRGGREAAGGAEQTAAWWPPVATESPNGSGSSGRGSHHS